MSPISSSPLLDLPPSPVLASALIASATASLALAAPLLKRADNIDTTILQYALTLENLENAFYSEALAKFDAAAFNAAGFPSWVRGRVAQIGGHEAQHASFLSSALGDVATKPCNYSFPYTDVKSFLGLAGVIENVGVTAYLGAANKITNPDYITAAGSILTVEARHQAWIASAIEKQAAWNGPEDTPLGFSQVYSIAAAFITSCPASNPTLPVKAFPAASIVGNYTQGGNVKLDFNTTGQSENLVVYYGLSPSVLPIFSNATVDLPTSGIQGYAYGVITTAVTAANVSDNNTVAGPIIMYFPFNSSVPAVSQ